MAEYKIGKGGLVNGKRRLIMRVQDADGQWRTELFGEIDDELAEARLAELLADGKFSGRWDGE